jgi:phosphoenolpyruvate carboxylase
MGSWIGGDRDGNPFVTADVMRGTLRLQSSRVLRFYLKSCTCSAPSCRSRRICRRLRRSARAGRSARPTLAASQRRAVSARGIRHLCPADRDGAKLEVETRGAGRRSGALRERREFKADLDVLTAR